MRKIKFTSRAGSILLFVFSSIAMMSGILIAGLKSATYQNLFFCQAAHSYPFFDKDGNLHGLFNVERESMENLMIGVCSKNGNRFTAKNGEHYDYKQSELEPIDDVLKKLKGCPEKIEHNACLKVNAAIRPIDNKLPFKSSFEKEIKHALHSILKDEKILSNKIDNLGIKKIASFDNLCEKLGLNDAKKPNAYDGVKKKIDDTFTFNDKIDAVNFFAANKYVRLSILNVFCDDIKSEKFGEIDQGDNTNEGGDQTGDTDQETEKHNETTYAFEFETDNETLKNSKQNLKMLSLMMKYSSKFSSTDSSNKKILLNMSQEDQENEVNINQFFSESEWMMLNMDIIDDKYAFFHRGSESIMKLL